MGLFDKVKKILFDEDEVEVPVGEDELPEREPKKEKISKSVIDDHNGDEVEKSMEDTIVEIKLPNEDAEVEQEEEELPKKAFKFDVDIDDDLPVRTRTHEDLDELPTHEALDRDILRERDRRIEEEMNKRSHPVAVKTPAEEIKDYKKLLEDKPVDSTMKKPFKVTPVISPVFGYVDPEYTPDEEPKEPVKREPVKPTKSPRDFGPVSYNDAPIPVKTKVIKEEITELNSSIDEMVKEEPVSVVKKTTVVETEIIMPEKKEEIPDVETSGIEEDYLNNGIEDAFETTSEFDKIKKEDEVVEELDDTEEYIPGYEDESVFDDTKELEPSYVSEYDEDFEATAPINLDELDNVTKSIKNEKNDTSYQIEEEIEEEVEKEPIEEEKIKKTTKKVEKDDDENLDETIETDLFNLIDSMYKSDSDDEEEDE